MWIKSDANNGQQYQKWLFAVSEINKIGIGSISIFLLKARVSYLTIPKRKNLSLPLKDETDQFVTCLVLPECLSVKIVFVCESLFLSIIVAKYLNIFPYANNGRSREKKILAKQFAHAISVQYQDLVHTYVYWIWLRSSASYVIMYFLWMVWFCTRLLFAK